MDWSKGDGGVMRSLTRILFFSLFFGLLFGLPSGSLLAAEHSAEVKDILNFHPIEDGLATAGQLLPEHVAAVVEADFELVVNLATASEERNATEAFLLTSEGINYVQIPVLWEQPRAEDLQLFFAVMNARGDRNTLVHCFANYRASAFTYLYRVLRLGVDEVEARKGLDVVWSDEAFSESPQWRLFINEQLDQR